MTFGMLFVSTARRLRDWPLMGQVWSGERALPALLFCALIATPWLLDRPGTAATSDCSGPQCVNLVFDGDSISAGNGASPGHGLDNLVAARVGDDVQLHNVAVGGRPVHECLRLYDQRVAPLFDPSSHRNIIIFHAGDNDVAQGSSAEETYAAFTKYVAEAHRQGWKIVVSTELRHADFSPLLEEKLENYNTLLKRNRAGADAVVDLDTDRKFKEFAYRKDPTLFTHDGIHPSDGGYILMADAMAPPVKRLAGR